MKLTKEECEKAYDVVDIVFHKEFCEECKELESPPFETFVNSMTLLEELVKEHFDNPPLKWEELKLYIPYWDDKEKQWCYFTTLNKDIKTGVKVLIGDTPMMSAFKFKEDCFYEREVKE